MIAKDESLQDLAQDLYNQAGCEASIFIRSESEPFEVLLVSTGSNFWWKAEYVITDGQVVDRSAAYTYQNRSATINGGTYAIVVCQIAEYDSESLVGSRPNDSVSVTKVYVRPRFNKELVVATARTILAS